MSLAAEYGFKGEIPGHELEIQPQGSGGYYFTADCTCGLKLHFRLNKTGLANGWSIRSWRIHLDAIAEDDKLYPVGVIQKKRVRWDLYVMPRAYSGASDFEGNAYQKDWAAPGEDSWAHLYPWAVAVRKSNGEQRILHISRTMNTAVQWARNQMDIATGHGHDVYYEMAELDPPPLSPVASLTKFVTQVEEALVSHKLGEVQETLATLDGFLASVPILTAMKDQLAAHEVDLLKGIVPKNSNTS